MQLERFQLERSSALLQKRHRPVNEESTAAAESVFQERPQPPTPARMS
jgi:hypothetical protein